MIRRMNKIKKSKMNLRTRMKPAEVVAILRIRIVMKIVIETLILTLRAFPGQKWKNNEKWKNDQKNEKETLKRSVLIEKWKVELGFRVRC